MADAADSKSAGGNPVGVRLPPSAVNRRRQIYRIRDTFLAVAAVLVGSITWFCLWVDHQYDAVLEAVIRHESTLPQGERVLLSALAEKYGAQENLRRVRRDQAPMSESEFAGFEEQKRWDLVQDALLKRQRSSSPAEQRALDATEELMLVRGQLLLRDSALASIRSEAARDYAIASALYRQKME